MYIYDVKRDQEFIGTGDLGTLEKKMVVAKKSCTYPLVYRLVELTLLLPVATTSIEMVFSAMNRLIYEIEWEMNG